MSVDVTAAVAAACSSVREEVWNTLWRKGATEVPATDVIELIRSIRTTAHCTEERLPDELITLVVKARDTKEPIKLKDVIVPLNNITKPAA